MNTWTRATKKVVEELKDQIDYVAIYDGGKTGKFRGAHLKMAYETEAIILDWIIETPI